MILNSYIFWLLCVSLFCLVLERIFPWRKQALIRKQFSQDLFWLFFNGYFLAILLAFPSDLLVKGWKTVYEFLGVSSPGKLKLLKDMNPVLQFFILFVFKDFIEWCVHYMLHKYRFLWNFHKLHHSIVDMDWMGNMRFHWMEIVVYRSIKYFPMLIMGAHWKVVLTLAVVSTLIGHLNHSNLNLGWGVFGYIINSPRFHIWHHDVEKHLKYGQNYAITLSIWDWLFGTAWRPAEEQPKELGFSRMGLFPDRTLKRFIYPLFKSS